MTHIMAMLLSFYLVHAQNPDLRMIKALQYLASEDTIGTPLEQVDATVYSILWRTK